LHISKKHFFISLDPGLHSSGNSIHLCTHVCAF
jgi:hypothetical protein